MDSVSSKTANIVTDAGNNETKAKSDLSENTAKLDPKTPAKSRSENSIKVGQTLTLDDKNIKQLEPKSNENTSLKSKQKTEISKDQINHAKTSVDNKTKSSAKSSALQKTASTGQVASVGKQGAEEPKGKPPLLRQMTSKYLSQRLDSFGLKESGSSSQYSRNTKAKNVFQGIAYGAKTGQRATDARVNDEIRMGLGHRLGADAPKKLDATQIDNPNYLHRQASEIADVGSGAQAAPSFVEYLAAVIHTRREFTAISSAKVESRDFKSLSDKLKNAKTDSSRSVIRHEINLKKGKARLAELHLKNTGTKAAFAKRIIGGMKAYFGFGKYTVETGIFATNLGLSAKRSLTYSAAVGATATVASTASLVAGATFNPISAVYYSVKAKGDVKGIKKNSALNETAKDIKAKTEDVEMKSVIKRIERKTSANKFEKVAAFISNSARAAISTIGSVGAVGGIVAALGGGTAVAALATAWPVILGLGAAAAALTVGYCAVKAVRQNHSKQDFNTLTGALDAANKTIDNLDKSSKEISADTVIDKTSPVYDKKVKVALARSDDVELFPTHLLSDGVSAKEFVDGLRDRYNKQELQVSDLEAIALWSQNMLAARDSGMAGSMLMVKLTEDVAGGLLLDDFKNYKSPTLKALKNLGVSKESLEAVHGAIIEVTKKSANVKDEDRQAAFLNAQKLLLKELHLR